MGKIKEGINKLLQTGFFHIFASNVANKVLGFISSMCIVRIVSKVDYGIYAAALNRLSFFLLVTGLGMVSAVLQLCSENAKDEEKNLQIYRYGSSVGIRFNIFLGVAIIIGSLTIPSKIEGANDILLLLAFIPFAEIINEFQKIYFRSRLNNQSFAYSNTMGAFFVVVFSVTGAFLGGIKGLILGRYIAAFTTALITQRWLKAPIFFTAPNSKGIEKSFMYRMSVVSMCNNGLSELLYLFDILCISEIMGGADVVADYKVAIVIPTALVFIPASLIIYVYPYFSMNNKNKKWLKKNTWLLLGGMAIFNALVTLFLIAFAPQIISIIFGKQYLTAVSIFRVSAMGYFFTGTLRTIFGNLLVTQRRIRFNFFASLTATIVNIGSNYVLVLKMGAIGAAWTTLLVSALSGIAFAIYYFYIINKLDDEVEEG